LSPLGPASLTPPRENSGDDDFFSSDIPLDDDEAKALGVSRGHDAMVGVEVD
jgi:hypothetical protein